MRRWVNTFNKPGYEKVVLMISIKDNCKRNKKQLSEKREMILLRNHTHQSSKIHIY